LVGDIRRRTTSRVRASDPTVKFPVKHDGTAGKNQSGEDRPAAPAFRARGGVVRDSGHHTQTASSQGSVPPRLDGRVHNKVKGVSHLAFWTRRRRRRGGEQRNGLEQRKQGDSACCRGSRAGRRRLQQVRLLPRGGDLTTDGFFLPRAAPAPGRTAMESKPQAQD
jgi:hypothetical protein